MSRRTRRRTELLRSGVFVTPNRTRLLPHLFGGSSPIVQVYEMRRFHPATPAPLRPPRLIPRGPFVIRRQRRPPVPYLMGTGLGDRKKSPSWGVHPSLPASLRALKSRPNIGVCVRRRERREVLFSRRAIGFRGAGRSLSPKTFYLSSQVRCKK